MKLYQTPEFLWEEIDPTDVLTESSGSNIAYDDSDNDTSWGKIYPL